MDESVIVYRQVRLVYSLLNTDIKMPVSHVMASGRGHHLNVKLLAWEVSEAISACRKHSQ